MTNNNDTNTIKTGSCGYCGTETDGFHSGVWECGRCWTWRKLDGPAARYWAEKMNAALSNLDMHDMLTFLPDALGSDQAALDFIHAMDRVRCYAEGYAQAETIRRSL